MAQLVKNPPAILETRVQSLGWEDPLEKGKATHSSVLPGEFHGLCNHEVAKSQIRLSGIHFHLNLGKWQGSLMLHSSFQIPGSLTFFVSKLNDLSYVVVLETEERISKANLSHLWNNAATGKVSYCPYTVGKDTLSVEGWRAFHSYSITLCTWASAHLHQHNKLRPTRNSGSIPGSGGSPGVRNGLPLQYSFLEKCHGQRSLVSYNPWGYKESDTTEHAFNIRVFPGGKESACQFRRHKRLRFHPLVWRRKWERTPLLLSGKSHGQRRLAGYSPWGHKELNTTEQLSMNT